MSQTTVPIALPSSWRPVVAVGDQHGHISGMTSNANKTKFILISLIYAEPGPSQGPVRGGPARVGHRGGAGTALLAALGEPSPGPPGGVDRGQARPAHRPRDPVDAG